MIRYVSFKMNFMFSLKRKTMIAALQAKNASLETSMKAANSNLEKNTAALESIVAFVKEKLTGTVSSPSPFSNSEIAGAQIELYFLFKTSADGVSRFQKIVGDSTDFREMLKSNDIVDLYADIHKGKCPKAPCAVVAVTATRKKLHRFSFYSRSRTRYQRARK